MGPGHPSRILLGAEEPAVVEDIRRLLEEAGHVVRAFGGNNAEAADLATYQLALLHPPRAGSQVGAFARRWLARPGDPFIPLLVVTADASPAARLAAFEAGADACLARPFTAGELLAQVRALLRIKEWHDRLAEKAADMLHTNKRLQQAHQRVNEELELARRIQLSFLPQTLPNVPGARFAVHYRPCGRVGGDFYDIFRLDECHVGFYVADAMGHGVPASLLTIFLKRGVRAKEIIGKDYRIIPPNEVLQRLNRELVDQSLADNPFITMVYGVYNHRDQTVRYARAGHPFPLYIPAEGEPVLWKGEGSLLGIVDTKYELQTQTVRPGDKILFYTDGLDCCTFEDQPAGRESLLACASRHRSEAAQDFIDRLSSEMAPQPGQPDDLTLLVLEVME